MLQKFAGRHAYLPFELLDEIKIVIEAHRFADFGQGKLCVCQ